MKIPADPGGAFYFINDSLRLVGLCDAKSINMILQLYSNPNFSKYFLPASLV